MKNPIPYFLPVAIVLFCSCSKSSPQQIVQTDPPIQQPVDHSPDIYAAGTIYKTNSVAAYWKNDSLVELTKSPLIAEATGIAVLGKDIYVSGFYDNGSGFQACYWKNGQLTDLSHGYNFEVANAIAIKGQDI